MNQMDEGLEWWQCQQCYSDNVCKPVDYGESKEKIVVCEKCKGKFIYQKKVNKPVRLVYMTKVNKPEWLKKWSIR